MLHLSLVTSLDNLLKETVYSCVLVSREHINQLTCLTQLSSHRVGLSSVEVRKMFQYNMYKNVFDHIGIPSSN